MSIAIRMGHMKNTDQAAVGIIPEYETIREYVPYIIEALKRSLEQVIDVTPITALSMADSLTQGVNKANESNSELFISCHVNAAVPEATGSETIYFAGSEQGRILSIFIGRELEALGFNLRGAREDVRGLYELRATNMPAVIVEPFFCTNHKDVELYKALGPKRLGEAIAKGILNYKGVAYVPEHEAKQEPIVPYVKDLCGQGINMQMFDDHLEIRINDKPWKVINFDN